MDFIEFLWSEYKWIIETFLKILGLIFTILTVVISFKTYKNKKKEGEIVKAKAQNTTGTSDSGYINNLFKQSPLIGRVDEIKLISEILKTHQLITLEGTGGCGKSSLAVAAARKNIDSFRNGACFIELAPVPKGSNVLPQVIGKALGIKEQASKPPTKVLSEKLAERQILLILDNCEHLLESCKLLITEIINNCDEVKIIATSRVKMNLPFEEVLKVNPLNIPDIKMSLQELKQVESIILFMRHGKRRNSKFKLSNSTKEYVIQICNKFDGIPLAIQLAASQLDTYSIEKISELIDNSLSLLKQKNGPFLNDHHVTMTAAIKWSYDLLDENQKRSFRRLSIFADDFTSEAAINVSFSTEMDEHLAREELKVFIESNLLNPSTHQKERRFFLLEPIRQFGLQELEKNDELNIVAQKFYKYFLTLGEQAKTHFLGEGQNDSLNFVEEQISNFRLALLWAIKLNDFHSALKLSAALWRFWEIRGFYEEGRETLKSLLEKNIPKIDEYYQILGGLGTILWRQGKLKEAEIYYRKYLEEEEKRDYPYGLAMAINDMGHVLSRLGDYHKALSNYKRANKILLSLKTTTKVEKHSKDRMIAVTTNNIGNQHFNLNKLQEAKESYQLSIKMFKEIGNYWESGYPLYGLANVYYFSNQFIMSRDCFEEAYQNREKAKDTRNMGRCKNGLAKVELKFDNAKKSSANLYESFNYLREVDDLLSIRESILTAILLAAYVGELSLSVELASFISLKVNSNPNKNNSIAILEVEPIHAVLAISKQMTTEEFENFWKIGAELDERIIYDKLEKLFDAIY